jgi:hypothetical protein
MGMGTIVVSVFGLGLLGMYVHLLRSRTRVMAYHKIPTPRINELSHGGGGA